MSAAKVLIVGGHDGVSELETRVADLGYAVCGAVSSREMALAAAAASAPDLLLIDLDFDEGAAAADRFQDQPDLPVVHLTGTIDEIVRRRMRSPAAYGCVLKPYEPGQLLLSIEAALAAHERRAAPAAPAAAAAPPDAGFLTAVLDALRDGIMLADGEGRFLFVNQTALSTFGTRQLHASADRWHETYGVFESDGRTPLKPENMPVLRAAAGEEIDSEEAVVRHPDRSGDVIVDVEARPVRNARGKLLGGVARIRDVTARKALERRLDETLAQLRNQAELLDSVFKGISDGVVVTDEQGDLIMYNPSAGRILGIGGDDPRTGAWRTSATLFQLDKVTPYAREEYPIARALRGEETNDLDVFLHHKALPDGAYFNLNGRPLLDENGKSSGSVVVFRDVTERMLATDAVSRAFADGRMEMVDTLLHNVGNAINSVGVGVDSIRERVSQNEPLRRLRAVADALAAHGDDRTAWLENDPQGRNAIPFLLSVVGDLAAEQEQLTLTTGRVRSRVEHIVDILRTQRSLGRGTADRKQVQLKPAIQAAVRVLQESLDKSGIRVELDCARAPDEIRIQESQFHQMIVNLVKNSIEAIEGLPDTDGPRDRPCIRIAAYTGTDTLVIDIADNGAGIAPEHMNALFSAGFSTKDGGSGIGLHSAANFVAGAGGHIEPRSEGPGRGATMRIRFALPPPPPPFI